MAVYLRDSRVAFEKALMSVIEQDVGSDVIRVYLAIDGPIDDILKAYVDENRHYFYRVVSSEDNLGLAGALNLLIQTLSGEDYVFRMDSDDESLPGRFAAQISYLDAHPEVDVIGTAICEVDAAGAVLGVRRYPLRHLDVMREMAKSNPVAHPTACFRGARMSAIGFYPSVKHCQDLALWFSITARGFIIENIPDVLYRFNVSGIENRRGWGRAAEEFLIYWRGIKSLHGFSALLIYPALRFVFRAAPPYFARSVYRGSFWRFLLNSKEKEE